MTNADFQVTGGTANVTTTNNVTTVTVTPTNVANDIPSPVRVEVKALTSASRNITKAPGLVVKSYEVRNRTSENLAALYTLSPEHNETGVLTTTTSASVTFAEAIYTAPNTGVSANLWGRVVDNQSTMKANV